MMVARRIVLLSILASAVLAACAGKPREAYRDYPGERPDSEVAILRPKNGVLRAIDGKPLLRPDVYHHEARLTPGRHRIDATAWFLVSVYIVRSGEITVERSFDVEFKAGNVYELHADRTVGPGFRVFMWIKNATTGEIVAGQAMR